MTDYESLTQSLLKLSEEADRQSQAADGPVTIAYLSGAAWAFAEAGTLVLDSMPPEPIPEAEYLRGLMTKLPEEVTHRCPPEQEGVMPCCGRTPLEASSDRITLDPELVTCTGLPQREES